MFRGDIMDEFLHDDSLPDSCTSEESYFSSLEHRTDKIDDLDTRLKKLSLRREFFELR